MPAIQRAQAPSVTLVLASARERLQAAGIIEAPLDAVVLLAHAIQCSREELLLLPRRFPLSPTIVTEFEAMLAKRLARVPVAQIIGRKEFWSLEFEVSSAVLTPRPDSETLIEAVLRHFPQDSTHRILDLGTGSGALLLALLHEYPNATGLGVDKSFEALEVARRNAANFGLVERASFLHSDWCSAIPLHSGICHSHESGNLDLYRANNDAVILDPLLRGDDGSHGQRQTFDIIVANPPYIALDELPGLEPEVRNYEPAMALTDGGDGLTHYRAIASQVGAYMTSDAVIFLEVGAGQARPVQEIFTAAGFAFMTEYPDLAGIPRCVIFKRTLPSY